MTQNEKMTTEISKMFGTWNKLKREYTLMNNYQDSEKYFEHKANFLDLMFDLELRMRSVQSTNRQDSDYTYTKK